MDDKSPEQYEHDTMRRSRQVYNAQLMQHPDCADPDHPGCGQCWDEKRSGEHE